MTNVLESKIVWEQEQLQQEQLQLITIVEG